MTGYQIRRGTTILAATGSTSTTVSNLTAATTYTLTVVALDAAGNASTPSVPVTVTTDPAQPPTANLAHGRPTTESSHTQTYSGANVVAGAVDSYWESANNAFPQ